MSTTPVWLYEFVSTQAPSQIALGIMTFGLDTDAGPATNPIGKYGNVHFVGMPFVGSLSCVTPPTSATAIFDVKFSHDNGVTWTSIFPAAAPYQYPVGATGFILFTNFANVTFAVGDLLRVDVIQSGGAAGIEGVIRWQPAMAPTQQLITGLASIRGSTSQAITGKAKITYRTTLATIPGVARISVTELRTITGKARINLLSTQTITGKARITAMTARTITGVASITPAGDTGYVPIIL